MRLEGGGWKIWWVEVVVGVVGSREKWEREERGGGG